MTLLVRSLANEETDEVTVFAAEIHENAPPAPPEQPLDGSVTEGWRTDSTDLGFPMASEPGASIASGIKGWFSRRDSNTEAEKEKVAASFTNDGMKTAAATGQPPDIKRSPTDVKMPDSTEVVGEQLRAATDFGLPIAEPRVGDANAYLVMSNGSGSSIIDVVVHDAIARNVTAPSPLEEPVAITPANATSPPSSPPPSASPSKVEAVLVASSPALSSRDLLMSVIMNDTSSAYLDGAYLDGAYLDGAYLDGSASLEAAQRAADDENTTTTTEAEVEPVSKRKSGNNFISLDEYKKNMAEKVKVATL
jgi:hypothetical protein